MSASPWIANEVTNFLKKNIKKNTFILEFGSGNSTIFFSKLTKNLFSVEHNKDWYNKIKNKLENDVTYILKSIDYISRPPINKTFYNCDTIEQLLGQSIPDGYFDIIIIDGIDRVNCAYESINKLKKNGILVLDDSNRIENPASDGSYEPIKLLVQGWEEHRFRSKDRNTDYWIKP